jgi:hypothetical protein
MKKITLFDPTARIFRHINWYRIRKYPPFALETAVPISSGRWARTRGLASTSSQVRIDPARAENLQMTISSQRGTFWGNGRSSGTTASVTFAEHGEFFDWSTHRYSNGCRYATTNSSHFLARIRNFRRTYIKTWCGIRTQFSSAHPKFPLNFGIIHCVKPILPQTRKFSLKEIPFSASTLSIIQI